jgi:hypothetical protein
VHGVAGHGIARSGGYFTLPHDLFGLVGPDPDRACKFGSTLQDGIIVVGSSARPRRCRIPLVRSRFRRYRTVWPKVIQTDISVPLMEGPQRLGVIEMSDIGCRGDEFMSANATAVLGRPRKPPRRADRPRRGNTVSSATTCNQSPPKS